MNAGAAESPSLEHLIIVLKSICASTAGHSTLLSSYTGVNRDLILDLLHSELLIESDTTRMYSLLRITTLSHHSLH